MNFCPSCRERKKRTPGSWLNRKRTFCNFLSPTQSPAAVADCNSEAQKNKTGWLRHRGKGDVVQEDGAGGISPVKVNASGSGGRGFGERKECVRNRRGIGGVV